MGASPDFAEVKGEWRPAFGATATRQTFTFRAGLVGECSVVSTRTQRQVHGLGYFRWTAILLLVKTA
jgi:hypothetical protein